MTWLCVSVSVCLSGGSNHCPLEITAESVSGNPKAEPEWYEVTAGIRNWVVHVSLLTVSVSRYPVVSEPDKGLSYGTL